MRGRRHIAALVLSTGVLLGLAPAAGAAVTASWSSGTLTVRMSAAGDVAHVLRSGSGIAVEGVAIAGTARTISQAPVVKVYDDSPGGTTLALDMRTGGRFGDPGTPCHEVTFQAHLGAGDDTLQVRGTAGYEQIMLGASGGDLDAYTGCGGELQLDGADRAEVFSEGSRDLISGGGREGIDGPVAYAMTVRAGDDGGLFSGGTGPDQLIGGAGDDQLYGSAGNDALTGAGGDDELYGGEGDDLIQDQLGDDVLDGGPGWDTVSVDALYAGAGSPAAGVRLDLSNLARQDTGAAGHDLIAGVEALTGSPLGDTLIGNDGTNHLSGGDGGDVLAGGGGDDALAGEAGDDTLAGDAGNDTLSGDAGSDTASYASSAAGVGARLGNPGSSSGASGADVLNGMERLAGSAFGDALTGDDGDNRIDGGAGDDTIEGRGGHDDLVGGDGADKVLSRDGILDTVACGAGRDAVDGDTVDTLASDCEPPDVASNAWRRKRMRVRGLTAYLRGQTAVLHLLCPADIIGTCSGTVGLEARIKVNGKLLMRRVGTARIKPISAARVGFVGVRISRPARLRLRTVRSVRAVITIQAADTTGRDLGGRKQILLRRPVPVRHKR